MDVRPACNLEKIPCKSGEAKHIRKQNKDLFNGEGIPDPYGGYGQGQFGAYSPFALATPHQAPQAIVTAMQGLGNFGPQTVFWADHLNTGIADTFTLYPDRTVASSDVIHTDPRFDSGATNPGGPPHTLD